MTVARAQAWAYTLSNVHAASQITAPARVPMTDTGRPSKARAPLQNRPWPTARMALATTMDQTLEISPRAATSSVVSAVIRNDAPQYARAVVSRCCSQDNSSRQPAMADVNTMMASKVDRSDGMRTR